jgi:hypothetical protein
MRKQKTTANAKLKQALNNGIKNLKQWQTIHFSSRNYDLCANIDGRIDELNSILRWLDKGGVNKDLSYWSPEIYDDTYSQ